MKQALSVVLALFLLFGFAACGGGSEETLPEESLPFVATAEMIADFSCGNADNEALQKSYPYDYDGHTQLDPNELAKGLTSLTGLDFFVTITSDDKGYYVDWAKNSTLVAGLDDREQKEDFHFFDAESLNWFMMDSMRSTLLANDEGKAVYFSMDGGKDLVFEELSPINEFPAGEEFMGSVFYFAHSDVRGEDMPAA